MSETKFTPGPWELDDENLGIISKAGNISGNIICDAPNGCEDSMKLWGFNAKLIAAAPDMFEIIKGLYDYSMQSGHKGVLFPKIEAAYLKVTE